MDDKNSHTDLLGGSQATPEAVPFGSNAVRLSGKQWIVTAAVLCSLYVALPWLWKRIEPLHTGENYRIPYTLSEDYWLYSRVVDDAMAMDSIIPVVGDSVVWGQYVKPDETLSHALNDETGERRFANLGVNGTHPTALAGLLDHFAKSINDRKVVLHYNPLWTTSKRRDLQTTKATTFNHPQLVPQFYPRIPSYDANTALRLSRAINCRFEFLSWTDHLRKAYFENKSVAAWATDHPYVDPIGSITLALPQSETTEPSAPVPWSQKDATLQSFEWVALTESLQWAFFRQSVGTLRSRGNSVFVLLGPFNEHLLTAESKATYRHMHDEMTAWLQSESIPLLAPDPLPSDLYADASHPLSQGYVLLAQQLMNQASFKTFIGK